MVQDALTLKGRTVAITRPRGQAEDTGKLIEKYGGKTFFVPSIEIKGTNDLLSVKRFVSELMECKVDYVLFMSVNGVKFLLSSAEKLGQKTILLANLRRTVVVAVGPKTAEEVKSHDIPVNLVPAKYSSEGLLMSFGQLDVSGKSIWIPRTRGATASLENKLEEMGGKVTELYVYESSTPSNTEPMKKFLQALVEDKIHAVFFSSSLSARNLWHMLCELASEERLRELVNKLTVVAIGPVTAKTLAELGLKVDVMPSKYLIEDAITALAQHWNT